VDTLTSLQILQSESHPNAFNQGPGKTSAGSKESLSVYGLFYHLAQTPQGKAQLRRYFLRPSIKIDTITERHDFISVLLRPDNASALQKITMSLKKIKNLRPVMINLHKGFDTGSRANGKFKATNWGTILAVS
jgi:DNA mismatch repair protein MSH5